MKIVIDLFEDGDTLVDGVNEGVAGAIEEARALAERREQWLNWMRHNEAVMPQIVPVEQEKR